MNKKRNVSWQEKWFLENGYVSPKKRLRKEQKLKSKKFKKVVKQKSTRVKTPFYYHIHN